MQKEVLTKSVRDPDQFYTLLALDTSILDQF
jgi:hypothetical protein